MFLNTDALFIPQLKRRSVYISSQFFILSFLHFYLRGVVAGHPYADSGLRHCNDLNYAPVNYLKEPIYLVIPVCDKNLTLLLKHDNDFLNHKPELLLNNDLTNIPLTFLVQGYVKGDQAETSFVYGSMIDGIFDGVVSVGDETFFIEKVPKYVNTERNYHSQVYTVADISAGTEARLKRFPDEPIQNTHCGLTADLQHLMEEYQTSPETMHTYPFNKRQLSNSTNIDPATKLYKGRTCSLSIQTDQTLWAQVFASEGAGDSNKTYGEILAWVRNLIQAANRIYGMSDFGGISGINFRIQRLQIFDSSSCPARPNDPAGGNPFCQENVDISNYLNINSLRDYSDFCLHFAMAFRDFKGALGLSWVASSKPSSYGGICEVYRKYKDMFRSLNTGVITMSNYQSRVSLRTSQLTFAHEIGHSLGANHDPGPTGNTCMPNGAVGNYLMFASANPGDKLNNDRFSTCSKDAIAAVLRAVLENPPTTSKDPKQFLLNKRNCFTDASDAFCGNKLVEEGEQCDCGYDAQECAKQGDMCCYPKLDENQLTNNGCQRKPNIQCSPSEGACCLASNCSFSSDKSKPCRVADECADTEYCNGNSAQCPLTNFKPDLTPCADNARVCRAGACNGSICDAVGLVSCFLLSRDPGHKCEVACMRRGGNPETECYSSFNITQLKPYYQTAKGLQGIMLPAGAPCDNYLGTCDVYQKCRTIDPNQPYSQLEKFLFGTDTEGGAAAWIEKYWWAVLLIGVGVVLLVAVGVRICFLLTPSSNPVRRPNQGIRDVVRNPRTILPGQYGRRYRSQLSTKEGPPPQ